MSTTITRFPSHEIIGKKGSWLTLIHGASQNRRLFEAQIAHFRSKHRLLLIDLPGHGDSADVPGPYGLLEYATAVTTMFFVHRVARTHLWGTHTGATVSLLIACGKPEWVSSLILEGVMLPGMPMPYTSEMIDRARTTIATQGREAAINEWYAKCAWFDMIRQNPEACRAEAHRKMLGEFSGKPWLDTTTPQELPSLWKYLPEMPCPTLIMNGEFDHPEFHEAARVLGAELPNARRSIIPGAGGFPLWECPGEVNRQVKEFLKMRSA